MVSAGTPRRSFGCPAPRPWLDSCSSATPVLDRFQGVMALELVSADCAPPISPSAAAISATGRFTLTMDLMGEDDDDEPLGIMDPSFCRVIVVRWRARFALSTDSRTCLICCLILSLSREQSDNSSASCQDGSCVGNLRQVL